VRPEPSPDGRWLAFVRRLEGKSALFLKDLTSGAERPIVTELDQDLQEVWGVHGLYPNMDWTPDSTSIVFWAGGEIRRVDIASGNVTAIPFRVEDTRKVYEVSRPAIEIAPVSFDARMVRNAVVSPDGSRVVFEVAGRLYTKDLPDGEPRRLTSHVGERFEYFPAWSPDGRRVAFIAWTDRELGHVHSVAARGGRSSRLTQRPGHLRAPRYSSDGGISCSKRPPAAS
jgi:Tol biopolymer transport system component